MATEDTIIQSKKLDGQKVGVGNEKKEAWKKIGLGSATGILVGAGAIYATAAQGAEVEQPEPEVVDNQPVETPEPEIKVADVKPGQSFSEAFAEARAEVGPGGVFHWNGGVYGTYYEDEWNAMSDAERQEWAESVKPEYGVDRIDTQHISNEHPRPVVTEEEPAVNVNIEHMEVHVHGDEVALVDENEEVLEEGADDVHVITVGEETVYDVDGQPVTVTDYVVDGYTAAAVDVDGDGLPDLVAVDVNDNGILDDGEAMDMETGDLLTANGDPIDDIVIA